MAVAVKRGTNGIAAPRMQVRHTGGSVNVSKCGSAVELLNGAAFGGGFVVGNDDHGFLIAHRNPVIVR